ncbi:hypothetical protein [Planococcus salinus]|uniref:Secreted repeat protein with Y-X4-D motif n=1 Tax=Planococcus salinus TaxID=1848460 RepID=A0A3M8P9M0_9BACL|nr:hypothetical protein [Planococcus salinus]RNF40378.1 hypothetical protein EEX84_02835 [Planococcus salinus]
MDKRLFLYAIFSALFLLSACGDAEPVNPEVTEMPPGEIEEPEEATEEEPSTNESSGESAGSLMLLENEEVGSYLADSEGMTLYYFANDEPDMSNCTGDCLVNWPAFTAQDFEVPEGFDENDFGTITREDNGEEQVTFKGYPLYYFINDEEQGDANGEGLNDAWYIVNNDTTFPQ